MANIVKPVVSNQTELRYLGSDENPGWWVVADWSGFQVNGGSDICVETEVAIMTEGGNVLLPFEGEVNHTDEDNAFLSFNEGAPEYPNDGGTVKVRYKGASLGWSEWSIPVSF